MLAGLTFALAQAVYPAIARIKQSDLTWSVYQPGDALPGELYGSANREDTTVIASMSQSFRLWGAIPGGPDCTAAMQLWAASGGGILDLSGGDWYIAAPESVVLPANCQFVGDGNCSLIGPAAWPVPSNCDISKSCFYLVDGSLRISGVNFRRFTHTFKARNGIPLNLNSYEISNAKWSECYAATSFTDNQRSARADITVQRISMVNFECSDLEYGFNLPCIYGIANIGKHTFLRINRTHMVGGTVGNVHCLYLGTGYDSGAPFTPTQWDSLGPASISGGVVKQVKTFSTTEVSGSRDCNAYVVHGNSVNISDFDIDDMVGITTGEGAEAIYTKARYVNISSGVIRDSGSGQASINIKGSPTGSAVPGTLGHDIQIDGVSIYGTKVDRLCCGVKVESDSIRLSDTRMSGINGGYGVSFDGFEKDSIEVSGLEVELTAAGGGILLERAANWARFSEITVRARGVTTGSLAGIDIKTSAASSRLCKLLEVNNIAVDFDESNTGLTDAQTFRFTRNFPVKRMEILGVKSFISASATTIRHIRVTNEGNKTIDNLDIRGFSGPAPTSSNIAITGNGMACLITIKDCPAFITRATGSFSSSAFPYSLGGIGLTSLSAMTGLLSSNVDASNTKAWFASDPLGSMAIYPTTFAPTSFSIATAVPPTGTLVVGWEVVREQLTAV